MPSSLSSTVCSTPTNDSVEKVIKNDTVRYQRKGYGLFSAILLSFSFFYYVPKVFKAMWPSILENLSSEYLLLIVMCTVHTGTYFISNMVMYVIYKMKLPFFERYRVSDKPWPWESKPEMWKELLKKTFKILALSHFVIVPLITYLDSRNGVIMRTDLESFPEIKEILAQILFFMFCEDFLFYWGHRFLHIPQIYPYIHKVHHEYNITVSISAEYAHPLEFIVANLIPTNAGPKILGPKVHLATYCIWIIIRLMETADGHCGYEFSWSPYRLLPLSGSSIYHNFHHSHNVGNFGSFFTFWDTLCGTNRHYFKYLANKEKKQLAVRMQNQYNDLADKINNDPNNQLAKKLEQDLKTSPIGSQKFD